MIRRPSFLLGLLGLCLMWHLSGCAYYNTFFHAQQFYDQAVEEEKKPARTQNNSSAQSQARGRQGRSYDLYSKCIAKCQKLADRFPTSKWRDDASFLMGKAYYGKKDYLAAKGELLRFLGRYPDSNLLPGVYYYLGLAHYQSEDFENARSAWATLAEEFPKAEENKEVSFYLAQSYKEDGEYQAAHDAYETYIVSRGRSKEAFGARLDRAAMWLDAGELERAREELILVRDKGRTERQQLEASLYLGDALESQGSYEAALDIYWNLAYELDSNYLLGRMTDQERRDRDREWQEKAEEDNVSYQVVRDRDTSRKMLPKEDPKYENLARVLLREGEVLAKMGRSSEAILAYEQVMDEYPKTAFSAEAQYRVAYTYEVYEENLEEAEMAYKLVSTHGRSSFSEDAIKRASRLNKVKHLAAAEQDSTRKRDAELAQGRFLKAELFLFQQDRPAKAVEEYEAIQRDFPGTDFEGKAALAEAYVRLYIQEDAARGRAALQDVMRRFGDTEFGVYARRILRGPDPEPKPDDFAGPPLALLLADENIQSLAVQDSVLIAEANRRPEDPSFSAEDLFRQEGESGVDPVTATIPEALQKILNLDAVPAGGHSPIISAWDREPRTARNRLSQGFPFETEYEQKQRRSQLPKTGESNSNEP